MTFDLYRGLTQRHVQRVTLKDRHGYVQGVWIRTGIVDEPDDLLVNESHLYTVVTVEPQRDQPSDGLPIWSRAHRWQDPADQVV